MRAGDRDRILALASALAALGLACASPAARAGSADAGRALFLANCATCHLGQSGLVGQAGPPDLLHDPLPRGDSEAALTQWTAQGTGAPGMPAFAEGLSTAEIAEIVRYIRAERALRPASSGP